MCPESTERDRGDQLLKPNARQEQKNYSPYQVGRLGQQARNREGVYLEYDEDED